MLNPMNLKKTLLMAAFGLIMSALTAQAGYTIVDVGTLGGNVAYANGINASGRVVGSSPLRNGDSRAFLYQAGVLHDIGFLGNSRADLSYANAINASGLVVGFSDVNPVTGLGHAFLFNGQMHDLGTLGGDYSSAGGINALGEIVGWSNPPNTDYHAFTYANGKMTDIGTLGGSFSVATGVNNIGQVVGYSNPPNSSVVHAFLYTYGHMYDLGMNPILAPYQSIAAAINDHSQVVGYTYTVVNNNAIVHHAFLDSAGTFLDLGGLFGPNIESQAYAINNSGEVVGIFGAATGDHGFLYRGGVVTDLNSLLPPNSGWVLTNGAGINDKGQICGDGLHNGLPRVYLLTP
jgi:probable HAF family extracellular repeat protein